LISLLIIVGFYALIYWLSTASWLDNYIYLI